jgi:hypothetical protein
MNNKEENIIENYEITINNGALYASYVFFGLSGLILIIYLINLKINYFKNSNYLPIAFIICVSLAIIIYIITYFVH